MIFAETTTDSLSLASTIIFWVTSALIAAVIIIPIVHNNKVNKKVKENSPYVKDFIALNNRYKFKTIGAKSDTKTVYLNTKRQFDTFDYVKKGSAFIRENSSRYLSIVSSIDFNKSMLEKYNKEIKELKHTSDEQIATNCKLKLKNFIKRETNIVSKMIQKPQTNFSLIFKWEYTSPAGRNHYSRYCTFSYNDIKSVVEPLKPVYTWSAGYSENRPQNYSPKTETPRNPTPKAPNKVVTLDDIEDLDD